MRLLVLIREKTPVLNVERPTVNEESITAASSATKTTRKSLQLLKLPKDIQGIDCKDVLVKSHDRNYRK